MKDQAAKPEKLRADETTKEQAPVTMDFEVIDQVNDQSIVKMMIGQTIQGYVYAAFAIANKLSVPTEKAGVGKTALWNYIKQKYGVASRNDMTEQQ